MKLLFLNFLFFVGFALILVQCAKMFPSEDPKPIPFPPESSMIKNVAAKEPQKLNTASEETTIPFNKPILPFFKYPRFRKNVIFYINSNSQFNNPNVNFTSLQLIGDYQRTSFMNK
jgi:hypothetical protein